MITRCDRCYRLITDPIMHGVGLCPLEPRRALATAIITDDIPGGEVCENYGPKEVTFYSETERKAYMEAHGLSRKEKWCPTPGTDIDPAGRQNPARYIDPQTMENARALAERAKPRDPDAIDIGALLRGQFVLVDGGRDAIAIVEGDAVRSSRVARRIAKHADESLDA